jgi:hypothetical protein
MDNARFDAMTRQVGRRGVVRGLLGIVSLGGVLPWASEPVAALAFCTERRENAPCKKNGQCCSGKCKKRKGKKKGKCRCGGLQAHCANDTDCCGQSASVATSPQCDFNGVSIIAVCCAPNLGECETTDDCCGTASCSDGLCAIL